MRKDSISEKAIEQAYLIYAEQRNESFDYSHTPTDYARGTILEPEHTSVINSRFGELLGESNSSNDTYQALESEENRLEAQIDALQESMKISRLRGNFKALQEQMKAMYDLIKRKEYLDSKMAVQDLGKKQTDDYEKGMHFSEQIESVSNRIQELEALLQKYNGEN